MKKVLSLLFFLSLFAFSNGQAFFPANLNALITDENPPKGDLIEINSYQLNEKGFLYESDSLYVNKDSGEMVKFKSNKENDIINIRIDYYTVVTDLTRFLSRLKVYGLKKVNENIYEEKVSDKSYRIQLQKNTLVDGKKFTLISVIFSKEDKPENNGKKEILFPAVYKYPLQGTTFFFETDVLDDKKNKDQYLIKIQLSEEKKYSNKITFLDDVNFLVTLASKKTFTGTFYVNNNKNSYPLSEISLKLTEPKVEKGGLRPIVIKEIPNSIPALKREKNTLFYYQYFFNRNYAFKFEQNDLLFENTVNDNVMNLSLPN